jgi:hypothetical protein
MLFYNSICLTFAQQKQPRRKKDDLAKVILNHASQDADDGYGWRKYGQKSIRSGDVEKQRMYYKCSYAGCFCKKQIEPNGDVRIFVYPWRIPTCD